MKHRRITRNRLLARYLRWLDRTREHKQMVRNTAENWQAYLDNQDYRDKHWHKELEVK